MHTQLLGIDWGTSNRRAYLIARDGRCLARHEDDQGLLAIGGRFPEALEALRRSMGVSSETPVLMSGMVGSAHGWQEVPYLDSALALACLPENVTKVRGQERCAIVPGYVCRNDGVDVMRGEESQLLGATALGIFDGWLVLPGTHSKWVHLQAGAIQQLHTYMTGEMYAMLGAGGTLAALMANGSDDEAAFDMGLDEARAGKPLTHALFGIRARVVAGSMPASMAKSYVSGLLIGTEFAAARAHHAEGITLVASHALSERYAKASARYGMTVRALDPDQVYCAALAQFFDRV